MRRNLLFTIIAISIGASIGGTLLHSYLNRPPHSLEVDATRDTTDISGTLYRIRLTNTGTDQLTGIVAELGPEDVQTKDFLGPGQSYYFYPEPETPEAKIIITTNEGIRVETDYRSPTKVLGLPGAGR